VNVFVCGEGKTIKADRDQDAAYLAHQETEFGWGITILLNKQPVASKAIPAMVRGGG
jgi:hypothetical protein